MSNPPIIQNSGIYRITNKVNGKVYIGSSVNTSKRSREHFGLLRLGRHQNRYLQRAFNLHGETAFEFDTIEYINDVKILLEREQAWINKIGLNLLYNINPIASKPPSQKGVSPSVATREKLSLAGKGKALSAERKAKISLANKGKKRKPFSAEHREKTSRTMKGRTLSAETKAKISLTKTGKIHSPETRMKLSLAHKGQKSVNKRAVKQINPTTGEVMAIFSSVLEAARATEANSSRIVHACQSDYRKSGGYRWEYT